ncbi:hypothetical protein CDAR_246821 [Caerostris darwini]|uniref:Uncharacterized protein n=1 Tax=Caerostris darwini TaxID=1538125 RepID=A0AAV4UDW6_9ARAC|nr:hypothetical protein CDAR_246821 [Caerostris darwini]
MKLQLPQKTVLHSFPSFNLSKTHHSIWKCIAEGRQNYLFKLPQDQTKKEGSEGKKRAKDFFDLPPQREDSFRDVVCEPPKYKTLFKDDRCQNSTLTIFAPG